jgi:hypothetical protein
MIGPDGMPMDEGPPGDDEGAPPFGGDDEGGPPPGAGGGGSDSAPPPSGKGDDSKKAPSKKGDSKKPPGKKESRRYRGLHGQQLTEGQFIRHMAAALSGAHPAVLERLRADASLLPRAAHSPEYVPVATEGELRRHMSQDHGAGALPVDHDILRKLHDHDHAARSFGWEESPDAAHSPGFVAARGKR